MESSSLNRRQGLEEKVPELERTIGMVTSLQREKVVLELSYVRRRADFLPFDRQPATPSRLHSSSVIRFTSGEKRKR